MGRIFLIAARSLALHRRRTLLLGAAIACVTGLLVVLMGLSAGIQATLLDSATALITGHVNVGGFYKITPSQASPTVTHYKEILEVIRRSVPELDFVVQRGRGGGKLISETGSLQAVLLGVEIQAEPGLRRALHIQQGNLDDLSQPDTLLLFSEQAQELGVKVGDSVTLSAVSARGVSNTADLRVVAVAQSLGMLSGFGAFVPAPTLRTVHQLNENTTGTLQIYLKDIRQAGEVQARLRQSLADAGYSLIDPSPAAFFTKLESVNREDWTGQRLDVTTWQEEISFMQSIFQMIDGLAGVLTFILLLIITVGLMNTLWISIRERTREIGTLRAIGMQRGYVVWMFLIEAFLLGLSSTAAGALGGALFCAAINAAHIGVGDALRMVLMRDTLVFQVNPSATLGVVVLITACITALSVVPSFLAARLKPVTAIHHVG